MLSHIVGHHRPDPPGVQNVIVTLGGALVVAVGFTVSAAFAAAVVGVVAGALVGTCVAAGAVVGAGAAVGAVADVAGSEPLHAFSTTAAMMRPVARTNDARVTRGPITE